LEIIKVNNLEKKFKYYKKDEGIKSSLHNLFFRKTLIKNAVKGISFSVDKGEIVGFLGPNGAGKTTTLKILAGIMHPSGGTANVMGYVPWERDERFRKQFSIVMGQKNQLWWDLPAIESLNLNKCIYELDDADYHKTVEGLAEYLNVKELLNVQVRRLSLGERMKMELIGALIYHPKVIYLDEPTIGLDLIAQKTIRDFMKYYNQQSKATVILTSHYMKDIEELCKRTIVINRGEIVYDGDIGDINETLNKKKVIKVKLADSVSRGELERFGTLRDYGGFNATLEINREEIRRVSQEILRSFSVIDINIEDIPLEESIEFLYRKEACAHEVPEKV